MSQPRYSVPIPTPDGQFIASYGDSGLCGLSFPRLDQKPREPKPGGSEKRSATAELPARVRAWHALVVACLAQALAGRAPGKLPPLDLSSGTPFQQAVWAVLSTIPPGSTLTYGGVAEALGRPGAVRAVGGACGANPVPVLIPCHRVVAAGGKIGGFSGGLPWKRLLLSREGLPTLFE